MPIRLSTGFLKETLQARRDWPEVFKVMESRDLQPRLHYPEKLSFRLERQINCFPDKVKLKEFIITKPLLYKILKGLILKNKKIKVATNSQQSTTESKKPN